MKKKLLIFFTAFSFAGFAKSQTLSTVSSQNFDANGKSINGTGSTSYYFYDAQCANQTDFFAGYEYAHNLPNSWTEYKKSADNLTRTTVVRKWFGGIPKKDYTAKLISSETRKYDKDYNSVYYEFTDYSILDPIKNTIRKKYFSSNDDAKQIIHNTEYDSDSTSNGVFYKQSEYIATYEGEKHNTTSSTSTFYDFKGDVVSSSSSKSTILKTVSNNPKGNISDKVTTYSYSYRGANQSVSINRDSSFVASDSSVYDSYYFSNYGTTSGGLEVTGRFLYTVNKATHINVNSHYTVNKKGVLQLNSKSDQYYDSEKGEASYAYSNADSNGILQPISKSFHTFNNDSTIFIYQNYQNGQFVNESKYEYKKDYYANYIWKNNAWVIQSRSDYNFGCNTLVEPNAISDATSWKVYPNPSADNFVVDNLSATSVEGGQINFYNSVGKLVKTEKINYLPALVNVSDLTNGAYILNIVGGDFNISQKLMIQK